MEWKQIIYAEIVLLMIYIVYRICSIAIFFFIIGVILMKKKIAMEYKGKGNTWIKVNLLNKARKGTYFKDVIEIDIKSKTHRISGIMTEEEALILAGGLINAVTIKMLKEKRL